MENIEVFFTLRHNAIVSRDRKQNQINAVGACEHVTNESRMTRHIVDPCAGAIRKDEIREAQLDRNSARLLLLKPVRFLAGKSANQCRLAMIDVPGSAYDRVN